MTAKALVEQLSTQAKGMEALQKNLAESQLMNDPAAQAVIFDMKDYLDSLKIVTELVAIKEVAALEVTQLAAGLGAQQATLISLIQQLQEIEEQDSNRFFGKSGGEIRRTRGSLQGILELNQLLLQENRGFQQQVKQQGVVPAKVSPADEQKKSGLLQRIFGKK